MVFDIFEIFSEHGPVIAFAAVLLSTNIIFVLRDWKRITLLETRINAIEQEYRKALSDQLQKATEAIERNNRVMEKLLLQD